MKNKLIRITTVPISLAKLLEGQLDFMKNHFEVTAISVGKEKLEALGEAQSYAMSHQSPSRKYIKLKIK